jgi:demethylmenaquinone methyltransferase / 2-methoxy-6-polyprenyl-1,4-benzoquinol methylase
VTFQLPSQNDKADYVLKQFDRIARKYDFANDLISFGMHRLWKARAVDELVGDCGQRAAAQREAEPAGELRFLDVCTGTGDLALLIAGRPGFAGTVVGLDFSLEMLSVAQQRSAGCARSLSNLCWQKADAQKLPFADDSFDGAVISFGLRNLTDLQKGLNEMSRVVRPGGRVVNLDLGRPELPVFTPLFLLFFERIVPAIGAWIFRDGQAYNYLPASRRNYPAPEAVSEMFRQASLIDVTWTKLGLGAVALHVGTVP